MITFLKNGNGLVACDNWQADCWVNVIRPTAQDTKYITEELGVPTAFYEDIEDVDERPRIEVEDGWCFILMRIPYKDPKSKTVFSTVPLGIIFKDDIFVSVCFYKTDIIPDFVNYSRRKNITKTDNINFIFRFLLSSSIWFLKYLKQINIQTKAAERQLENSVRNEEIQTLLHLENCLVFFATSLRGNEILTHRLKNLRSLKDVYNQDLVEDVEIESKQALELTNIYTNILSGMMNAYASIISNNLNIVMKRLTSISIVLMMPTLIASFFGMNLEADTTIFNWMFYVTVAFSILFTAVTSFFFIKKKWF